MYGNSMKNKNLFLINKTVLFFPRSGILRAQKTGKSDVTLLVPVSRCLNLLLQHPGKVVDKATFFSEVWEKNGQYVTANTFYQNISLLRKALKSAGLNEDVIRTVPRQGIRFTGSVETLEDSEADSTSTSNPLKPEVADVQGSSSDVSRINLFHWKYILLLIGFLSLLAMILVLSTNTGTTNDVFHNSKSIVSERCKINYSGPYHENAIPGLLAAHGVSCKTDNVVFLVKNETSVREFLADCEKYTAKEQKCRSWLFIKGEKK